VGLAVLSGIVELWKKSLWDCVCGMDALVLTAGLSPDQLPDAIRGKRLFWMAPGRWSSPELVGFVGRRIRGYPMR
jgi:hypothetical protein